MNENAARELVKRWYRIAGEHAARAQRLGDCRAGEAAATEADTLRQCAGELLAALTAPGGKPS